MNSVYRGETFKFVKKNGFDAMEYVSCAIELFNRMNSRHIGYGEENFHE
jgi:hypothetical protein